MRLVAIFHCWDDWYLLSHAINNMRPLVDGIIVVGSTMSNYGEFSAIPEEFKNNELYIREPIFKIPMFSELHKRNCGIDIAKDKGYTHFITCDADEFYQPHEFIQARKIFEDRPELQGLVCELKCFFKSPTLTIGIERTLVPFIHRLTPTIKHEFNRNYPFAWSGNEIRIDPTRSLNINSGVEMCDATMLHYSWVRKDYAKKIRNSTARKNLEQSSIMQDLIVAKDGEMCKFYGKILHTVPNYFNLPEYDVMV